MQKANTTEIATAARKTAYATARTSLVSLRGGLRQRKALTIGVGLTLPDSAMPQFHACKLEAFLRALRKHRSAPSRKTPACKRSVAKRP